MSKYVNVGDLQVANELYEFINFEALPGSQVDQDTFWAGFEKIIKDLTPKNKELLTKRDELQTKINRWHRENNDFKFDRYKAFLEEIGYLLPEPKDFKISTEGADDEIALKAGPQLVVPVDNARYAINAANARWGSLYDALYGTDVINDEGGAQNQGGYNPVRGEKVIAFARNFLDEKIPLQVGTHKEAVSYSIDQGRLTITLGNGDITGLKNEEKFVGYQGQPDQPTAVLLKNNDNYFEIQIDRSHPIGKTDAAGVKDILLESALTSIMDCEDSVAAVDAQDKVRVYRNWLGLNKGNISATFTKGNKTLTRTLNPDRSYVAPSGSEFTLPGRALMLVRNVGHLMTNNAILDGNGNEL
jgi:malate synthase